MYRLDRFTVDDLVAASEAIRALGDGASTMSEAAGRIVRYVHDCMVDERGDPACALVRFYKTHRFDRLDPDRQAFAREFAARDGELERRTRCLTLVASAGREPDWNDPAKSRAHRAIPLTSPDTVARLPMVARLIADLGLEVPNVLDPPLDVQLELHHRSYNVFFVPEAKGSPSVPAQADFVERYGIRSVLGCGGMLPSGDMFALVLFTLVRLPAGVADLFKSLAPAVKAAVVPYTFDVF